MELWPLRLRLGADLRRELECACTGEGNASAFVVSGIGSLVHAKLRLAGADDEVLIPGPIELLTLAGSLSVDGAHLHMSVADRQGRVLGGHVGYGNEIRTTAEVLLVLLPGWQLSREFDAASGYKELIVRRQPPE